MTRRDGLAKQNPGGAPGSSRHRRARRVAELEAALGRARAASQALRRVGMAVASCGLAELFAVIIEATAEVLQADRATLYLREGDALVSRVKKGDEELAIRLPIGRGIAGTAAKVGKTLRVADAHGDPRFDPSWDRQSGFRTRSLIAAPIRSDAGETIGVLQALNKRDEAGRTRPFTRYEAELLEALAAQAAVSIAKAQLFEQMRSNAARLERALAHLELLYELDAAMSGAETVGELAARVVAKVGAACGAQAGALVHRAEQGELSVYAVRMDRPEELRRRVVPAGQGARLDDLLSLAARSAIQAPLAAADGSCAGEIAMVNKLGADSFSEDDDALVRLVSANVSTRLRLIAGRQEREGAGRLETLGRLLSGAIHDLRTPLAVISGYVQMMEGADDRDKRGGYGRIVAEQFELIGAMQRDLLAYARGDSPVLARKVDLARFFEELRAHFATDAEMLGVTILLEPNAQTGWFDEVKIARVLHNLMRNGLEAMQSSGGELTLSARSDGGAVEIAVADTGGGIPEAIRSRLFEPFVTAGKRHGTGLGLANVKRLVEEHRGSVQVRSSAGGTCFTVTLPAGVPASK